MTRTPTAAENSPVRPLADAFASYDQAAWRARAEAALAGRSIDKALTRRTLDGLTRGPFMSAQDAPAPEPLLWRSPVDAHRAWHLDAWIDTADPGRANAHALEALEGGASALAIALDPTGENGVAVRTAHDLAEVLAGVDLALAPVRLYWRGVEGLDAAALFISWLETTGAPLDELDAGCGLSPPDPRAMTDSLALARWAVDTAPGVRVYAADAADRIHEAGGGAVDELAGFAAQTVAFLRAQIDAGLPPAQAFAGIEARFKLDADVPGGVAKLRAARRLLARIAAAFGLDSMVGLRLHAAGSLRMLTRRDVWTNVVRQSLAATAAALGGADALALVPFTHPLGGTTPLARRLARNTGLVLMHESRLGAVEDPAAGAYAIEALTDQTARAAWARLQAIEAEVGWFAALKAGSIADAVQATAQIRHDRIATRRDALIGVSDFPPLEDTPPKLEPSPVKPPNTAEVMTAHDWAGRLSQARDGLAVRIAPGASDGLTRIRLSAPFEALGERAANLNNRQVWLAVLGRADRATPRLGFAANLFRAGGLDPIQGPAGLDAPALADAARAADPGLIVLCGEDAAYAEHADAAARALATVAPVWIAGKPGYHDTAWRAAGVERYIFAGCDALEALDAAMSMLERKAGAP